MNDNTLVMSLQSKEAVNQRQLMSLDLFLSGAKSQLQSLMSATTPIATSLDIAKPTTKVSSSETSFNDSTKNVSSSTTSPNIEDDNFGSNRFDPASTTVTSDETAFPGSTNFEEF